MCSGVKGPILLSAQRARGGRELVCGNTEVSREGLVSQPKDVGHPRQPQAPSPGPSIASAAAAVAVAQAEIAGVGSPDDAERALVKARSALAEARRATARAIDPASRAAVHRELITIEHAVTRLEREAKDAARRLAEADRQRAEQARAAGDAALAALLSHRSQRAERSVIGRLATQAARHEVLNASQPVSIHELPRSASYSYNGYRWTTDTFGQVSRVEGVLRLDRSVRHARHQRAAGHAGDALDEGGHLIAARFGGFGSGPNLIPQPLNLNRGEWKLMENTWASLLEEGKEVRVVIELASKTGDVRPDAVHVRFWVDGELHERAFENA